MVRGQDRHAGDLLEHNGVVYSLRGILAPGEGAVAGAEHTGHMQRVDAAGFERLDDDLAGVLLVILVDFLRRQLPRAGDRAVKVIGVGGTEGGQVAPRLSKGYRVGRVGVHDAAQLREGPVQLEMRFGLSLLGFKSPSTLLPFRSITTSIAGVNSSYSTPDGLMTNNPFRGQCPKHLPHV